MKEKENDFLEKAEEIKEDDDCTASSCCKGCRGGFRCFNAASPCYLYHCGEYPGTGPQ